MLKRNVIDDVWLTRDAAAARLGAQPARTSRWMKAFPYSRRSIRGRLVIPEHKLWCLYFRYRYRSLSKPPYYKGLDEEIRHQARMMGLDRVARGFFRRGRKPVSEAGAAGRRDPEEAVDR